MTDVFGVYMTFLGAILPLMFVFSFGNYIVSTIIRVATGGRFEL